jgi:hypothetical protein
MQYLLHTPVGCNLGNLMLHVTVVPVIRHKNYLLCSPHDISCQTHQNISSTYSPQLTTPALKLIFLKNYKNILKYKKKF